MTEWSPSVGTRILIGNSLTCVSAIKAALAVAFVSSWEASNHSQSQSPVLQNCLVVKRAGISVWDLELSNQAGPSHDRDKKWGPKEPLVPPQLLAWAEGQPTFFLPFKNAYFNIFWVVFGHRKKREN